jgi:hypothetical protein
MLALLTLTEVLLGFHLTETLGIDGIDALPLLVVVAAAGGVLLFVLVADAVNGGKGSVLGKVLVHRRHLVVHALARASGMLMLMESVTTFPVVLPLPLKVSMPK